jgi:hypothetical protein
MSWVKRSIRFFIFALMTIIFLMILGLFAGRGAWLEGRKQAAGKIRIESGTVHVLLGCVCFYQQKFNTQ